MASLSRRAFLAGIGAASVVAGLPASAGAPVAAVAKKPPTPTWIVGTPGENDHEVIRALTREAAIVFRAEECEVVEVGDEPTEDCDCGACCARAGYDATRVERWDGKPQASITDGDWVAAGFDAPCARCGYEANERDGGRSVNGKAICCDCMTIADWEVADPEYAAELREEMADV